MNPNPESFIEPGIEDWPTYLGHDVTTFPAAWDLTHVNAPVEPAEPAEAEAAPEQPVMNELDTSGFLEDHRLVS